MPLDHRVALGVFGVRGALVALGEIACGLRRESLASVVPRFGRRDAAIDIQRVRAALALLRKEADDHPALLRWTATKVELRPRGDSHRLMRIACDGEIVELMSALRLHCAPGVLRTVVSPDRA